MATMTQKMTRVQAINDSLRTEMARDTNLSTLDGRARMAERARPLIGQIPDGAFGDLMQQRLTELTGVGARPTVAEPSAPLRRRRPVRGGEPEGPRE